MVGLGWHMVVNRTSGQRGANEQHYDGPTLDSDVGPTIRTPEDQRSVAIWICRSLESSSLLLHFSGFWQYLFLQDGWYCASQANRSTPLILVSRCSSCFSCAIPWSHPTIIFKPNGSFCRPTTLHFNFLFPFLFTKYTVWFEYYFVRIKRPTASTFKITTACNGLWR